MINKFLKSLSFYKLLDTLLQWTIGMIITKTMLSRALQKKPNHCLKKLDHIFIFLILNWEEVCEQLVIPILMVIVQSQLFERV